MFFGKIDKLIKNIIHKINESPSLKLLAVITSIAAAIAGVYSTLSSDGNSSQLLAESVPKWFDATVVGAHILPTALYPNVKHSQHITFRLRNPTNAPIKLVGASFTSENGDFYYDEGDFVVPARGYQALEMKGDFHRNTSVCLLGVVSGDVYVRERRNLEFEEPIKGGAAYAMGLMIFNVTIRDQTMEVSKKPLSCT